MRALLLATVALAACLSAVTAAPRGTLLALLADPADRAGRFGPFFDGLEAAGWSVDVRRSAKPAADEAEPVSLKAWDTWLYDGVVVLPGKTNGARGRGSVFVGAGRASLSDRGAFKKPILRPFFFPSLARVFARVRRTRLRHRSHRHASSPRA